MLRFLLQPLRWVWRLLSPVQDSAQALLIRTIVFDLLRSMLSKNPNLLTAVDGIVKVVEALREIIPVSEKVASRVVQSAMFELKNDLYKTQNQNGRK